MERVRRYEGQSCGGYFRKCQLVDHEPEQAETEGEYRGAHYRVSNQQDGAPPAQQPIEQASAACFGSNRFWYKLDLRFGQLGPA
jgi:hypothetical protein